MQIQYLEAIMQSSQHMQSKTCAIYILEESTHPRAAKCKQKLDSQSHYLHLLQSEASGASSTDTRKMTKTNLKLEWQMGIKRLRKMTLAKPRTYIFLHLVLFGRSFQSLCTRQGNAKQENDDLSQNKLLHVAENLVSTWRTSLKAKCI